MERCELDPADPTERCEPDPSASTGHFDELLLVGGTDLDGVEQQAEEGRAWRKPRGADPGAVQLELRCPRIGVGSGVAWREDAQ